MASGTHGPISREAERATCQSNVHWKPGRHETTPEGVAYFVYAGDDERAVRVDYRGMLFRWTK